MRLHHDFDGAPPLLQYRNKLAWVIGINEYGEKSRIPPLKNAVRDADGVASVLAMRAFSVTRIPEAEATKDRLDRLFTDEIPAAASAQPDARILIYFAGHGYTRIDEQGDRRGYLVPAGANRDDISTFVDMAAVRETLNRLVAPSTAAGASAAYSGEMVAALVPSCRHVLVVLDCCHAGAFVHAPLLRDAMSSNDRLTAPLYQRLLDRRGCQLLASTTHDQPAQDGYLERLNGDEGPGGHSPFADAFIAALCSSGDQNADANHDGVVTATEIYARVADALERRARESAGRGAGRIEQTPGLWPLEAHEGGEFLVELESLNFADASALEERHNPFPGGTAFTAANAAAFYGRELASRELVQRLQQRTLVVLSGDSGAGKTSLLDADLVPRLEGDGFDVRRVVPPAQPLRSSAGAALLRAVGAALKVEGEAGAPRGVVLVIDPFDALVPADGSDANDRAAGDMLRLVRGPREERVARIAQVLAAADIGSTGELAVIRDVFARPDLDLRVILAVRGAQEPALRSALDDDPAKPAVPWELTRWALGPMNREELRASIEKPAALRYLWFDEAAPGGKVLDRLLEDATISTLPLLAERLHALFLAYVARAKRTGIDDWLIRWEDYGAIETSADIVVRRVGGIYDELAGGATGPSPLPAQQTLLRILTRMSPVEGIDTGDHHAVSAAELDDTDEEERIRIVDVMGRLVEARIVTQTHDADPPGASWSIGPSLARPVTGAFAPADAALVRDWPPLKEWRGQFGALRALRRLTEAARAWRGEAHGLWDDDRALVFFRRDGRTPAGWPSSWLEERFAIARLFARGDSPQFSRTERTFLERSLRRRRRTFIALTGSVVAVIVALSIATGITYRSQQRAVVAQKKAEEAQELESAARIEAVARQHEAEQAQVITLASQAASMSQTPGMEIEGRRGALLARACARRYEIDGLPAVKPAIENALAQAVRGSPLRLALHARATFEAAFSSDERYVLAAVRDTSDQDLYFRLFDATTGRHVQDYKDQHPLVPDGARIVALASPPMFVTTAGAVITPGTPGINWPIYIPPDSVSWLSPDGTRLVAFHSAKQNVLEWHMWSMPDGSLIGQGQDPEEADAPRLPLAMSPHRDVLYYTVTGSPRITAWHVTGRKLQRSKFFSGLRAFDISPDGRSLLVVGENFPIQLIPADALSHPGIEVSKMYAGQEGVFVSSTGSRPRFVTLAQSIDESSQWMREAGAIQLWERPDGGYRNYPLRVLGSSASVFVLVSRDGNLLATGDEDHPLEVLNLNDGTTIRINWTVPSVGGPPLREPRFSPSGRAVLVPTKELLLIYDLGGSATPISSDRARAVLCSRMEKNTPGCDDGTIDSSACVVKPEEGTDGQRRRLP